MGALNCCAPPLEDPVYVRIQGNKYRKDNDYLNKHLRSRKNEEITIVDKSQEEALILLSNYTTLINSKYIILVFTNQEMKGYIREQYQFQEQIYKKESQYSEVEYTNQQQIDIKDIIRNIKQSIFDFNELLTYRTKHIDGLIFRIEHMGKKINNMAS